MPKEVWTNTSFTIESPDAVEEPGYGKARRAAYLAGKELIDMPPGVNSLHENFLTGLKISTDAPFLGHRTRDEDGKVGPYVWQTYNEVYKRVKNLGSGLAQRGLNRQDPVGLYSINRPEWSLGQQASYMYAYTTVPLYDTLGDEAIEYIINQTEMRVCFATYDKAQKLIKLKAKLPTLDTVVVMDTFPDTFIPDAKAFGVDVIAITALEAQGAQVVTEPNRPGPNDCATICYTSGTTGLPKGVILSHRNILSVATAVNYRCQNRRFTLITPNEIHISFLPMAHVFELVLQQLVIMNGARIGFYAGDTAKLLDDVAELRPTVFVAVPRLFNRIYDKVLSGVKAKGGAAAFLFKTAIAQKQAGLKRGTVNHWLWDKLVFGNVRSKLGGRCRFLFTGSAPIAPDVLQFLRACFSVDVFEGYGQTETSAGLSITFSGDYSAGHVGVPLGCCEVRLRDIPEMNYTSKDEPRPRGEITVRGNSIFSGYYKAPDKTAETLENGWCRTGDVGQWDEFGRLVIIDRVKCIFKLAQGEYIAPEKIENVYCKHELVAQAYVHGDSLQASLVGVIVPDEESFIPWAKAQGFEGESLADFVDQPELKKKLLQQLVAFGKGSGLKGFENIRALTLEAEQFTIDNNLLTPTFKLRRNDAKNKYQAQIDAMYASLNA
ncbi:Long-chain-fatty-acid--CoA ligase 6 [Allomyces javanicus]|nr:Long-chain-fatty-acid--CoA ligase 6 [Allomyces javanicus]